MYCDRLTDVSIDFQLGKTKKLRGSLNNNVGHIRKVSWLAPTLLSVQLICCPPKRTINLFSYYHYFD